MNFKMNKLILKQEVLDAYDGFIKPLKISTRNFGRGIIGWSEGGTPEARKEMIFVINNYLSKRSQN